MVDTIPIGPSTVSIAVNEVTGTVYVLDQNGTLYVIDEAPEQVDTDGDGIDHLVDTVPDTPSTDFDDGACTTGSVVGKNGLDSFYIADSTFGGVIVTTGSTGGPLELSACGMPKRSPPRRSLRSRAGASQLTWRAGRSRSTCPVAWRR